MKHNSLFRLVIIACLALTWMMLANLRIASAAPTPPGADTVLIDHFEEMSIANYSSETLSYTNGPADFGKAADFTGGNWIRYDVPGWYEWSRKYDATGKQGTVEFWVYPISYGISLVNFNWNEAESAPAAGHILHVKIDAAGKLQAETWTAIEGPDLTPLPTGKTTLPLNQWTHVAFTWGDAGTRLYVNDTLDASTPDNLYPALKATFYVYVPYWGQSGAGYIDELHILKTQTGEAQAPNTKSIPVNTFILAGLGILVIIGGAGLILWRKRQSW